MPDAVTIALRGLADAERTVEAWRAVLVALGDQRGNFPFASADTNPIEAKTAELREACREWGIALTGDDHVRETDAARLLDRSARTLKRHRLDGNLIPNRFHAGRHEYALEDLAKHLIGAPEIDGLV